MACLPAHNRMGKNGKSAQPPAPAHKCARGTRGEAPRAPPDRAMSAAPFAAILQKILAGVQ